MQQWTFFGVIHPERYALTWSQPQLFGMNFEIGGKTIQMNCFVAIHASQIIVRLQTEDVELDVFTLRNATRDLCASLADFAGFRGGREHRIDIVSASEEKTGDWHIFGIEIPSLVQRKQNQPPEISSEEMASYLSDPHAALVLADLRHAMGSQSGFYVYRAVETIKQSMAQAGEDERESWGRLRQNLNVDRSALDFIKGFADSPRHGKIHSMTDDERAAVLTLGDEVITRYLEYLKMNRQQLDLEKFPPLKE